MMASGSAAQVRAAVSAYATASISARSAPSPWSAAASTSRGIAVGDPIAGPSRLRTAVAAYERESRVVRSRLFSSSASAGASQPDFYSVLGVSRTASQTDIKRQFYQLSKKYHPDMNREDENAKRKFQEVSEAYATLGQERSRRAYDASRYSSSPSGGSYGYSMTGGPSSMNAERRARAAYAWDYTRRRSNDSPRSARGSSYGSSDNADFSAHFRGAFASYGRGGVRLDPSFGFGNEHPANRLARMAERERLRRARAGWAGGFGEAGSQQSGSTEQGGNAVVRFLQGASIFFIVLSLGTAGIKWLRPSGRDERARTRYGNG